MHIRSLVFNKAMIQYKLSSSSEEIEQILELQQQWIELFCSIIEKDSD